MLNARARLLAEDNESIDKKIEQKKRQIDSLKSGLPSRQNKTKVSPQRHIQVNKQVNIIKNQILDLRNKKIQNKTIKGE
jgi:hypothetical protein